MLYVTPIFASVLALLYIYLSFRVIGFRRGNKIGLGDAGDKTLLRRMRAHANFAEYVPIALLLMAFAELGSTNIWAVYTIGFLLLGGRIIHAIGFGREPEQMKLRVLGMSMTFFAIIVGAVCNLLNVF